MVIDVYITRLFLLLPLAMKAYLEHGIKNLPQPYIQIKILFTYGFVLLAGETL
jgi:hypothetical protein